MKISMAETFKPLGAPIRKPEPPKQPTPEEVFDKGNHRFPDGRVQGLPKHQMAVYLYGPAGSFVRGSSFPSSNEIRDLLNVRLLFLGLNPLR